MSSLRKIIKRAASFDEWSKRRERARAKIDSTASELNDISQEIWTNPELAFNEFYAHKILTNFLENEGFEVTRNYHLDTAFKATFGSETGIHICIICEYDSLPEIGHGSGHNLIAECGAAAGIGIKAAMEQFERLPEGGRITILGTPAGGGKKDLIEAGAFEGIDVAMMSHPYPLNISRPICFCLVEMRISYTGLASHAAAAPWEGKNALDAAVMCYNSISLMRQHLKPDWRVHGTFIKAGYAPNIIPDESELLLNLRTISKDDMPLLKEKIIACAKGAATMAGCEVVYSFGLEHADMVTNPTLATVYERNATNSGIDFITSDVTFSTDMGDVSQVVPSIHAMFNIGTVESNHSRAFRAAAGSPDAQAPTLLQAKILAQTALDLMQPGSEDILEEIQKDFADQMGKEEEVAPVGNGHVANGNVIIETQDLNMED